MIPKIAKGLLRERMPAIVRRAALRTAAVLDPYARSSYAQEGEDLILARFLEEHRDGFYVDVGAHHPQRFSNTFAFYERGWSGINVEPDPDVRVLFQRLRPRDIHVQAGVSDTPGRLAYYRFNESALNTFDPELARRRAELAPYRIVDTVVVEVTTLADIFARHLGPGQAISFLTVDVEGYDLKVIHSNDWQRYRPLFVLVESLGAQLAQLGSDPSCRFLGQVGYEPVAKTLNTVIYRALEG